MEAEKIALNYDDLVADAEYELDIEREEVEAQYRVEADRWADEHPDE